MTMVVCPKILNTKWAIWSALVNDFVRAAEGVRARCVLAVAQCVRLSRPSDVASCHCERSEAIKRHRILMILALHTVDCHAF
ncbi:MAG: hypothetical protein HDT11_03595 [Helicobacter sp.]|nr:hypothetical protein [Helicobacter sp.]